MTYETLEKKLNRSCFDQDIIDEILEIHNDGVAAVINEVGIHRVDAVLEEIENTGFDKAWMGLGLSEVEIAVLGEDIAWLDKYFIEMNEANIVRNS